VSGDHPVGFDGFTYVIKTFWRDIRRKLRKHE
jgi:hypothetical protein